MKQFAPRFRVTLFQVASGGGTYDITNWLGESCVIRTSKSVTEPAGTFSITFVDKPLGKESLYGRIAAMDAIEIRAAHDGRKEPKLLMRGFVSDVRREEVVSGEGKVMRRVTITGQDLGKLMLVHRIHFLPEATEQQLVLSGYGALLKYFGASPKPMQADEFVGKFAGILNDHLKHVLGSTKLDHLSVSPKSNVEGMVPPQLVGPLTEMSYYQAMAYLLDVGAFNELFTEDHDDGSFLVAREVFSGPDGASIDEEDVKASIVSHGDARVANWFWVTLRGSQLVTQVSSLIEAERTARDSYDARSYRWAKSEIFGWRKMQVDAHLFPPAYANSDSPPLETYEADQRAIYPWLEKRMRKLQELNRDNAVLESAVLRVCGNEDIKAGEWLTLNKSDVPFRYYASKVEHEIQLLQSFETVVHGERGQGFLKRLGGGLYRPELNLKGAMK